MTNIHQTAGHFFKKMIHMAYRYRKLALLIASICCGVVMVKARPLPVSTAIPLKDLPAIKKKMAPEHWPLGCPVPIDDLVYVKLSFYGFDHQIHQGALIVHHELAGDVLSIFNELLKMKFPIERMQPIYEYNNDDEISMENNNTSAFNCRAITGKPGVFSQHSYGRAIDINPKINPYVKNDIILPKNGREFVNRTQPAKGKITRDSQVYQLFIKHGWSWGGDWHDLQDYQHFEKRQNGNVRVPS